MRATVDALSVYFDVITFSLTGERLDDGVAQVRQALDERRVDRAVICGVSFGGVVARRFAALHPERTQALVLASTPGPRRRGVCAPRSSGRCPAPASGGDFASGYCGRFSARRCR
jgi:pimeloyl-ACP methyl ester carboxylesterase